MKADLVLKNAKVRDVESFDILLGEQFSLVLQEQADPRWFSDNDNVLAINASGSQASIMANAVGPCEIQLQVNGVVQKKFLINVTSDSMAAALNVSFADPVQKGN
jgi:hypothetical protein